MKMSQVRENCVRWSVLSALLWTVTLSAGNLLPNGDFRKNLDGWKIAKWQKETSVSAKNGILHLRRDTLPESGGAVESGKVPVTPGAEYWLSREIRCRKGENCRYSIQVDFFDAKGKRVARRTLLTARDTGGKFRYDAVLLEAPANAAYAVIGCYIIGCGEAEFRDLHLAEAKAKFLPGNLVPDADFQREDRRFRNWHPLAWGGETEMKAGERSLILRRTEDVKRGGAAAGRDFAVKGGHEYAVAVETRIVAEQGFRSYVLVEFFDASGKMILQRTLLEGRNGTDGKFRLFRSRVSAPEKAVAARLCCCLVGLGEAEFRNPFFGEVADLPGPGADASQAGQQK